MDVQHSQISVQTAHRSLNQLTQCVGSRVDLDSKGYIGIVLQRQEVVVEAEEGHTDISTFVWRPEQQFTNFHYFNHDNAPSPADGMQRCMEWTELAPQACWGV
jgi:hypothetical protein